MTVIRPDDVRHIAALARLSLTEEEVGLFSKQLSDILAYVEKLNELNTAAIEVARPDVPREGAAVGIGRTRPDARADAPKEVRSGILKQAPESIEGGIKVPKVFSE